jgi:hypothetical protein
MPGTPRGQQIVPRRNGRSTDLQRGRFLRLNGGRRYYPHAATTVPNLNCMPIGERLGVTQGLVIVDKCDSDRRSDDFVIKTQPEQTIQCHGGLRLGRSVAPKAVSERRFNGAVRRALRGLGVGEKEQTEARAPAQ